MSPADPKQTLVAKQVYTLERVRFRGLKSPRFPESGFNNLGAFAR